MFELVPNLAAKDHVIDLKLCTVLFEDNACYPWIFLIPKIENTKNMLTLTMEQRLQLMREIALCEEAMAENFAHDQTNVAMIGNITPQLHVHVVCRKKKDPDWPGTVWGNSYKKYKEEEKEAVIAKIRKAIQIKMTDPRYIQS